MRIGFFDSGVGGITVLKEALKLLPNIDYLYYADTANVPYGPKSKEEVKKFVLNAVDFISNLGIDALVVACNTATSIAINDLRKRYSFPILGMEPAVKPAVKKSNGKRVLVMATELTLKEEKFQMLTDKVDSLHIVDSLPLPGLVEYAEKYVFDEDTVLKYLKKELAPFDMDKYSAVVLGCTHFIFYKDLIRRLLPENTEIIDGNYGTVKHLKNVLEMNKYDLNEGSGKISFYSSAADGNEDKRLRNYLKLLK